MPDFIPVLITALLVMLILFMAAGGFQLGGGLFQRDSTSSISDDSDISDLEEDTILLGNNFTISNSADTKALAKVDSRVSQGLISGASKTISFKSEDYNSFDTGKLKINVIDTNLYGNLIVRINGETVYADRPAIGETEFYFDKDVFKTANTMTVMSGGSGWRFWAPAIYDVNVTLYLETAKLESKSYKFDLDYVPDNAKIVIYGTKKSGEGEITVSINDIKVYKGYLNGYKNFDSDVLKAGENRVKIYSDANSEYDVYSAKVIVWDD